jgi:hypothetical protein
MIETHRQAQLICGRHRLEDADLFRCHNDGIIAILATVSRIETKLVRPVLLRSSSFLLRPDAQAIGTTKNKTQDAGGRVTGKKNGVMEL